MKTFNQALGEMKTVIWDTSPKTLQDAIDPEIWIEGFGRMLLSQHKARFVRASEDFLKRAKAEDYDYIEGRMTAYHHMLEGIQHAEKDMNTPAWKTRITKLKKAGK